MITIYVENEPSFTFPNNDAGHTQAEALFQVLCRLFDSVGLELPYGRVSKWLRDELDTTDRRFLHQF